MFGIGKKKIKHDTRISNILDSQGFKYRVDDEGAFHYGLELEDGRTHSGLISSETYTYSNAEYRQVHSAAFLTEGVLEPELCYKLLKENGTVEIGSWGIINTGGDRDYIVYSARIPANFPAEQLMETLHRVVLHAASVEERLA